MSTSGLSDVTWAYAGNSGKKRVTTMAQSLDLFGIYVDSGVTASVRELARLEQEWQVADAERKIAWERFRGTAYDQRLADEFDAKMGNFLILAQRIVDFKRMHDV